MAALTNKITMRLRPFCAATGLGPTKVYELIAAGEIESFTAGKARLIVVQSYFDYINRQKQNAPPTPLPIRGPAPESPANQSNRLAVVVARLIRRCVARTTAANRRISGPRPPAQKRRRAANIVAALFVTSSR